MMYDSVMYDSVMYDSVMYDIPVRNVAAWHDALHDDLIMKTWRQLGGWDGKYDGDDHS